MRRPSRGRPRGWPFRAHLRNAHSENLHRERDMTAGRDAAVGKVPQKTAVRRRSWSGKLFRASQPALVFFALILAWWLAVKIFGIPVYLLPPPQDVLPRLAEARQSLWNHSLVTIEEIVLGFALSVVMAIPLGLLIALSPAAKRMLYPLLVF